MPYGLDSLPPLGPMDQPQTNLPSLPRGGSLEEVMGQHSEFVEKTREENTKPPFEWSSKQLPNGEIEDTIKTSRQMTSQIIQDLRWKADTMAAMQQEVNRIDKQRDSGNPILDVLATVGGELAAGDPRLPPVVSALGRASLRLNPTYTELTDRKLGLMGAMGNLSDQSIRSQDALERTQIARDRTEETSRHNLSVEEDRRLSGALKDARLTAQKAGGPMSEESFDALMTSHGVKDPSKREQAYLAHIDQARIAVAGKEAEANRKVEGAKELATIRQDARVKAERELMPARAAISERLMDKRIAAMTTRGESRQADSQAFSDYQKARPGVEAVLNTKDAVGKLRQLIADNPDAVGAVEGRVPELLLTRKQAMVRAEFFTLLDAVRQSISGGTRFWNPQEFKNLSPKLAAAAKTEKVNMGIMDALDDFSNRGARNIVRTHPYAKWDQIGDEVWGEFKGEIFGAQEGSGRVNPEKAPSVAPTRGGTKTAPAEGGETATRRRDPNTGEWWNWKGGKWAKE